VPSYLKSFASQMDQVDTSTMCMKNFSVLDDSTVHPPFQREGKSDGER
jgi:hypothetical protein